MRIPVYLSVNACFSFADKGRTQWDVHPQGWRISFLGLPTFLGCKVLQTRNRNLFSHSAVQFSSVTQLCPTLCDPMNRSMPGLPVHHQLPEFTQTHVHRVRDAIQPSRPLSSPSPLAFNFSQHQGLFQWVSSSHQVAKVLEFQLQHQSFQWTRLWFFQWSCMDVRVGL